MTSCLRTARVGGRQGRRCCLVKGSKGGVLGPSKNDDSVAKTKERLRSRCPHVPELKLARRMSAMGRKRS